MIHCKYDELVDPKTLRDHPRNRNKHPKAQIKRLATIHRELGIRKPIVVSNLSKCIVAGHGNKLAMIENRCKAPVVYQDFADEAEEYAFLQADNAIGLWAELDVEGIKLDAGEILPANFNLDLLGIEGLSFVHPHLRTETNATSAEARKVSDLYSKKIQSPVYEPKGEKPTLDELTDARKMAELFQEIAAAVNVPDDVKDFLYTAASRHQVFNYDKIAEYYAHAPAEVQRLMEASALVIIDFKQAIERGFVQVTKEIAEAYTDEKE